jgi:NADH dehydrogenase (ubiquinone) Fe-S protein 6
MITSRRAYLGLNSIRRVQAQAIKSYSTPKTDPVQANESRPERKVKNVSDTNKLPTSATGNRDDALQEHPDEAEERRVMQAPNRTGVWSRSQNLREKAMTGPRFEQTVMEYQVSAVEISLGCLRERMLTSESKPRPYAAIDLIHKQPVRWIKKRVVSCDGGGGPLGHPRIFINVDKPQINMCTYCGLPFVSQTCELILWMALTSPSRPMSIIKNISSPCPRPHTHWNRLETLRKSLSRRKSQTNLLLNVKMGWGQLVHISDSIGV